MLNKWKVIAGLAILVLLAIGVYFVSDIYANCGKPGCGSHEESGGCGKHGEESGGCGKHGDKQPADKKATEDPNMPDILLKKADKLLKEVDKTKNVASLMKHCEQMLNKAAEIIVECNQVTEGPGWFDSQAVETYAKLMKKCLELTNKSQSLIPKDQKKEPSEKTVYKCPMGCETSDKLGKCSKCGMNQEKK